MNNLSSREKTLIFLVGAALVIALVYLFVLRPLNNSIETANATLRERQQQDAYYEELKASNAQIQATIEKTKSDIMNVEATILPQVEPEVAEAFLTKTFEAKGSKFLSYIDSEDIATDSITLPNGNPVPQKLKLKRVALEYATTDGYTIPESNADPLWIKEGQYDQELITDAIAHMGDKADERYNVRGYNEFMAALDEISKKYPSTVKIHKLEVEDSSFGFNYLRAEVDFFYCDLANARLLSETDDKQIKLAWIGDDNVSCKGGLIGLPLRVEDTDSAYFNFVLSSSKLSEFVNRPYCSYFSAAILADIGKKNPTLWDEEGNPIAASDEYAPKFEDAQSTPGAGEDAAQGGDETPAA